jgi:hypothetical protein
LKRCTTHIDMHSNGRRLIRSRATAREAVARLAA